MTKYSFKADNMKKKHKPLTEKDIFPPCQTVLREAFELETNLCYEKDLLSALVGLKEEEKDMLFALYDLLVRGSTGEAKEYLEERRKEFIGHFNESTNINIQKWFALGENDKVKRMAEDYLSYFLKIFKSNEPMAYESTQTKTY